MTLPFMIYVFQLLVSWCFLCYHNNLTLISPLSLSWENSFNRREGNQKVQTFSDSELSFVIWFLEIGFLNLKASIFMSRIDRSPVESEMASAVDAAGDPIPTSAVLTAAAKHIQFRCQEENVAFLKCKKKDPNPEKCLDQGRQVTRCVLSL